MKKERVIISQKARSSLREIYDYIRTRSKSTETAHYVRKSMVDACLDLKRFSGYSKESYLEEFPEDYRSISIWSYVIIYVVREKEVRVLNIVHSKQDPEIRKELR
jgi:plasmid stabilization system protein ParE